MTAFATADDLAVRLNRSFNSQEQAWVTALLSDAADHMRGVMHGNKVYPSTTSTYTAYPMGGRVALPQMFVTAIVSVTRDTLPIDYKFIRDVLYVELDDPITITYTYGLSVAPGDLVSINCALVSQMMLTVTAGLGLSAGGLSSVAIDDFKAAFADGGAGTGMTLTPTTKAYLEEHYGTTAWVVEASR